jgi:[calcium/calmodulin-dependent protein kinase] kinase
MFRYLSNEGHPHIVYLHETIDDPASDQLYLIQELCEGGEIMSGCNDKGEEEEEEDSNDALIEGTLVTCATLVPPPSTDRFDSVCRSLPVALSEDKARLYLRQMILGIEFCHRHNIIHRDIKPENVLLSCDGVVKICDFGVACRMNEKTTVPKGTPAFMAPEVLLPETVEQAGPQSDVWSLGATLFYMIHGTPPWRASNYEELNRKVRDVELTFPQDDKTRIRSSGMARIDPRYVKSVLLYMLVVLVV